jgi:hypothetical protein
MNKSLLTSIMYSIYIKIIVVFDFLRYVLSFALFKILIELCKIIIYSICSFLLLWNFLFIFDYLSYLKYMFKYVKL